MALLYLLTLYCPRGLPLTSKIVCRQSKIYKSLLGSKGLICVVQFIKVQNENYK